MLWFLVSKIFHCYFQFMHDLHGLEIKLKQKYHVEERIKQSIFSDDFWLGKRKFITK
jgi:hypothetical protein